MKQLITCTVWGQGASSPWPLELTLPFFHISCLFECFHFCRLLVRRFYGTIFNKHIALYFTISGTFSNKQQNQNNTWILGIILPIYLTSSIFYILTEIDDDVDQELPCIIMRDTIVLAKINLHCLSLGAVFRYT